MKTITYYELLEDNGTARSPKVVGAADTVDLAVEWVAENPNWRSHQFKALTIFESIEEVEDNALAAKVDKILSGLSADQKMLLREAFQKGLV